MKIWALFALAAFASAPAQADLTATYATAGPGLNLRMKIEIAVNGDLRTDLSLPGVYMIRREGHSYLIVPDPAGPVVEDTVDLGAVMQEQMAKMNPHFCDRFRRTTTMKLLSRGTTTIAGRTGESFAVDRPNSRPELVISHDPALAPLGAAMAAQFRGTTGLFGSCGSVMPMVAQMLALLDSGAPLQFGGLQLDTVETGLIDPAHFVLPAAPATRDQVRKMMTKPNGTRVTVEPRPGN